MPVETISLHPEAEMQESLNRVENLLHTNSMQMAALIETMQRNNQSTSPSFHPPFARPTSQAAEFSVSPGTIIHNSSPQYSMGVPFSGVLQDHELLHPLTIPEKHSTSSNHLLLNPAIREMLGQYPADYFLRLESKNEVPLQQQAQELGTPGYVDFDKSTTDALVAAFFTEVHCYHPLLNKDDFEILYNDVLSSGYTPSPDTCLCLVIFALGATAVEGSSHAPFSGIAYIQKALPDLISASTWSFTWDVKISQGPHPSLGLLLVPRPAVV